MRYTILGPARAEDDHGTPIPLPGPKLRALLTALALRPNHPVPIPTLIDDIWSTTPPTDAPAALQALVARLRRALGRHTITSEPGAYRLATTPTAVDLYAFEQRVDDARTALARHDPATAATTLREALSLWRGPALADLPDRTAATRPEALRTEAIRTRIEADLQLGRAPELVPELRELTETHPYDEPLHALLIRALHDAGRTAEALTAYEDVRRSLRESLGTDPGPPLRALHATLLNPPPGPPAPTPKAPTLPHAGTAPARHPPLCPPNPHPPTAPTPHQGHPHPTTKAARAERVGKRIRAMAKPRPPTPSPPSSPTPPPPNAPATTPA